MSAPTLTAEQLRAEARARADRACALIERAQNDLASACAELSALVGGIAVWKATGRMHDSVHKLWWRVHHFRNGRRYRLDDTNVAALRDRAAKAQMHVEARERPRDCGDAGERDSPGVRR